jgi:hypothetical protein
MKKTILSLTALGLANTAFASMPVEDIKGDKQSGRLCIYYGEPDLVNSGKANVSKAIETFSKCEVVVFGDGWQLPNNPSIVNTTAIIKGLQGKTKVFGYVPIGNLKDANGVCASPDSCLSDDEIKKRIDSWSKLGTSGVFLDEYGFDYSVTREKQNKAITAARMKNQSVFANAWVAGDAMAPVSTTSTDETGKQVTITTKSLLDSRDYYLLEDFFVNNSVPSDPGDDVQNRIEDAKKLSAATGVKLAAVSTSTAMKANYTQSQGKPYKEAYFAAMANEIPLFQWTDNDYSASNNILIIYPYQYNTSPQNTIYNRYSKINFTSPVKFDFINKYFYRNFEGMKKEGSNTIKGIVFYNNSGVSKGLNGGIVEK